MARSFPLAVTRLSVGNKIGRMIWGIVSSTLYRYSPKVFHGWRCFLLRCFGATIGPRAHPCPESRIWAPWNLTMEADSCLADHVDCYCVAPITIGRQATVSQYSYLCAASHDFRDPAMPLVTAPIVVEAYAWVAADVFVGPGVKVGEGAVVGARSTITHDVAAWTVVAGSPPRHIGERPRLAEEVSSGSSP